MDEAVKVFDLKPKSACVTNTLKLVGSDGWSPNMYMKLIQSVSLSCCLRGPGLIEWTDF